MGLKKKVFDFALPTFLCVLIETTWLIWNNKSKLSPKAKCNLILRGFQQIYFWISKSVLWFVEHLKYIVKELSTLKVFDHLRQRPLTAERQKLRPIIKISDNSQNRFFKQRLNFSENSLQNTEAAFVLKMTTQARHLEIKATSAFSPLKKMKNV